MFTSLVKKPPLNFWKLYCCFGNSDIRRWRFNFGFQVISIVKLLLVFQKLSSRSFFCFQGCWSIENLKLKLDKQNLNGKSSLRTKPLKVALQVQREENFKGTTDFTLVAKGFPLIIYHWMDCSKNITVASLDVTSK